MMLTVLSMAMISKILSPALKLWLRTQVEHIENLEIKISSRNRQIIKGYIPSVFIASDRAVYQGLHLTQVQLTGENIRVNLGQVAKGKPLRLLEPVRVNLAAKLQEADLQASLSSSLLISALADLLSMLLKKEKNFIWEINWDEAIIAPEKLTLKGNINLENLETTSIILRSGLQLASPQELLLSPLKIDGLPESFKLDSSDFKIDLGSDVNLEKLQLIAGEILVSGDLQVRP